MSQYLLVCAWHPFCLHVSILRSAAVPQLCKGTQTRCECSTTRTVGASLERQGFDTYEAKVEQFVDRAEFQMSSHILDQLRVGVSMLL